MGGKSRGALSTRINCEEGGAGQAKTDPAFCAEVEQVGRLFFFFFFSFLFFLNVLVEYLEALTTVV